MHEFKVNIFIITFWLSSILGASAGMGGLPLPKPPSSEEISEIMFQKTDAFGNHDEDAVMTREDLIKFFSQGQFYNDPVKLERIVKITPERNEKGGKVMAYGHFATKSGKIFRWIRYTRSLLLVSDAQHRTGFLLLDNQAVQGGIEGARSGIED